MSEQSTFTSSVRRRKLISGIEKRRNAAIERAEDISPVTRDQAEAAPLLHLQGVTTAAEFCTMRAESRERPDQLDKTPSLLVADPHHPNEYIMVPLGRRAAVSAKSITGRCWLDVRGGTPILVPENTIVYWR